MKAIVRCRHVKPISAGSVISIDEHGAIDYQVSKRRQVNGSWETGVSVRTHRGDLTLIEVDGNLAKFFQGHNLWGTDELVALVAAFMEALVASHGEALGLAPTDLDQVEWRVGAFDLLRVDVTDSWRLRNRADVLAWLRAAEQTAHLTHRGRGELIKGGTLVFGKHSRREALKLYCKAQEIEAHQDKQPALRDHPAAKAWAEGILRGELVLRSMSLKRRGLDRGTAWAADVNCDPLAPLRECLKSLSMTMHATLPPDQVESLRPGERAALIAWQAGADLRAVYPRRTFYRMRAALLVHGIDIATVMPRDTNVVPLVRVLEAVPAPIPAWAVGTPLAFEPRRRAA